MYGGQFGFQQCLLERGRWILDWTTKLGILSGTAVPNIAGYETMSMSGLVTTTDRMTATSFVTDDGIDAGTSIFYHGGFLGLGYRR